MRSLEVGHLCCSLRILAIIHRQSRDAGYDVAVPQYRQPFDMLTVCFAAQLIHSIQEQMQQ